MTGNCMINGKDAKLEWGLSLSDGGLSALMTPPPNKAYVSNKSRLEHGARTISDNAKMDERSITIPFHIIAKSKAEFYAKYESFCEELAKGTLDIEIVYQPNKVYHLLYNSCSQFGEYSQEMAKFSLKVTEPNPSNRTW